MAWWFSLSLSLSRRGRDHSPPFFLPSAHRNRETTRRRWREIKKSQKKIISKRKKKKNPELKGHSAWVTTLSLWCISLLLIYRNKKSREKSIRFVAIKLLLLIPIYTPTADGLLLLPTLFGWNRLTGADRRSYSLYTHGDGSTYLSLCVCVCVY